MMKVSKEKPDVEMDFSKDKDHVSFGNPHGFKKDISPNEYAQMIAASQGANIAPNMMCSPTTIRCN